MERFHKEKKNKQNFKLEALNSASVAGNISTQNMKLKSNKPNKHKSIEK